MTQPTPEDVLYGKGVPILKGGPSHVGQNDWQGGVVVGAPGNHEEHEVIPDPTQPGRMMPGPAKVWKKGPNAGKPILGYHIDVEVQPGTPGVEPVEDDDGIRRMMVDGQRGKAALGKAYAEAGVKAPAPGGQLWRRWTHQTESGFGNAATEWEFKYIPPAGAEAALAQPQQAMQAPPVQPQQQMVQPPAAAPVYQQPVYQPPTAPSPVPQSTPTAPPWQQPQQAPQQPAAPVPPWQQQG